MSNLCVFMTSGSLIEQQQKLKQTNNTKTIKQSKKTKKQTSTNKPENRHHSASLVMRGLVLLSLGAMGCRMVIFNIITVIGIQNIVIHI